MWQIAVCVHCQALAATPIDKISLREGLDWRKVENWIVRLPGFFALLKAGATSRKVAFLKTCDGLLRERIVLE